MARYIEDVHDQALRRLYSSSAPIVAALTRGTIQPGLAGAVVLCLPRLLRSGDSETFRPLVDLILLCPEPLPRNQWGEFELVLWLLWFGSRRSRVSDPPAREPSSGWYVGAFELLAADAERFESSPGRAVSLLKLLRPELGEPYGF